MTANIDLPLPGDWPRQRLLRQSALAHALLLGVALRDMFVTGHPFETPLNLFEGLVFVAAIVLAGGAFARVVRQASSLDLRFLWRGGVLLALLAGLAPPFLSTDVWDYVARGYVSVLGHNPYTTTVASLKDQPGVAAFALHAEWPAYPMPYGPISALLQWLVALLGAPWTAVYAWKALTVLAHLATAALVLRIARAVGSERDARRAFVLWSWNPWLLLESCGSAHNESFVALAVAATCLAVVKNRFFAGALAFGAAVLVKHGCAPLSLPLLVQAVWRKQRLPFLLGTGVVLLAVAWSWAHWWTGPGGFDWFFDQRLIARGSVASHAHEWFGPWASRATRTLGWLALAATAGLSISRARDPQSFARYGALAMGIFVAGCMHNFSPWYQLWWLPLFALAQAPVLERVVELLAWTGPLYYTVRVSTHAFGLVHESWGLLVAGLWPAVLALVEWRALTGVERRPTVADAPADKPAVHEH
jgi:hypothetical protein